jgi:hypothetical protein
LSMSAMPRFTRLVPFWTAGPGASPVTGALVVSASSEFWTDTTNLTR